MNVLKNVWIAVKEFATKYPAVLSGYIIYGYLFLTIMHYFLRVKDEGRLDFLDIFETFDAIPFMWLLAVALVKVIEVRSKLHESETQRLLSLQDVQIKHTQINTMNEVAKGLQHHINNPLAIIALTVSMLRRISPESTDHVRHLDSLDDALKKISQAMTTFSQSQVYRVDSVSGPIGTIASPPPLP